MAWYPFNGNANDESGKGNNGVTITASLTTDRFGIANRAYQLGSGFVELPNTIFYNNESNSFTISTWFIRTGNEGECLLSLKNHETTYTIYNCSANSLTIQMNGHVIDSLSVPNQWNHLVYTYDRQNVKIYLNGQLKKVSTHARISTLNDRTNFYMGARNSIGSENYWHGKADDLGIWNRALTHREIALLYNRSTQSCATNSSLNYSNWTSIAQPGSYTNIIKDNNNYYLRSQIDVFESSSLIGPWNSMNFTTQTGSGCSGRMLGKDWSNQLIVSTCHNSLYGNLNGTWTSLGLGGFGCSGNFISKLQNGRIIVEKNGFLRDLYISDDNGANWTNVTNVDNDYFDMVVAPNGYIYACGGSNTPSMTGLIRSTDNGTSFTQINAQLGISYCSGFAKDCNGTIYAVADNKIFISTDGVNWAQQCLIPSFFTTNPGSCYFVIASNGEYYLWGNAGGSICGFFKSSNLGASWTQINDLPINVNSVTCVKEIDGNIIVTSTQNVYAKSLVSSTPSCTLNATITATAACANQTSSITVTGGNNYIWTADPLLNITSSGPGATATATVAISDTNIHTFYIRVEDTVRGCYKDTSITYKLYPLPIVGFFLPDPQCLRGNSFFLSSGSFVNPGTISQEKWIINNTTTINGPIATCSFISPGTYPVKLISKTDRGCIDSLTQNVVVKPNPTAAFIAPAAQCLSGNLFTFGPSTSTATSPNVIDTLSWDFGDNHGITTTQDTAVTHSYLTINTFPVTLIVGSNGCFDTANHPVKIYPNPTAFFIQPDSQCLRNNRYSFASNSFATSPASIVNNFWKIERPYADTIYGSPATYQFTYEGVHRVELVSVSSDGCRDSITQTFMVHAMPQTSFNLPPTLCFLNNNFLFNSTSTISIGNINHYYWDFGDNVRDSGNPIRHPFTNPNIINYQVQLITESEFGCRDTSSRTVSFLASPIVNMNPINNHNLCSGDNASLSATASTPVGSITSYQWTIGGTDIPGANTASIQIQTSGVYQINVTSSNGCWASSSAETMIVNPLPVGNVNIPANNFVCQGGSNTVSCTPISNTVGYQWYMNGTAIAGATQPSYSATDGGIFSVQLTSQDDCKNFAGGSVALVLRKKPEVDFSYPTYCTQVPVLFNNSSNITESGAVNWLWDFGDASTPSTSYQPAHTFASAGTYTVTLTATPSDCPTLTDVYQKTIPIKDPIPSIRYTTVNASRNQNQALQCRDLQNGILWLPSRGISSPTITNPIFNHDASIEYTIRLTNVSGCLTFDTLLVRVLDQADIQVPTAFSPNGDNHNDYLDVFPIGISKFISFRVYTRWGKLIYETNDPQKKWNGTYLGKKQSADTYVWVAEAKDADDKVVVRRGQTILLR